MAGLSHTSTTRHAAAMIFAATINFTAEQDLLSKTLLDGYCELCQDIDITIRLAMFENFITLFPKMKHEGDREVCATEVFKVL